MNESTLEEIINATVNARLKTLIENFISSQSYKSIENDIEHYLSKITREEMEKREPEVRALIAEKVKNIDLSSFEVTTYTKLAPNQK